MEMCEVQPLNRVFLQLGSVSIYWYGVIIAVGAALGLWLAIRESKKRGLHKDTFVDFLVFAIPAAIISARIYYVAFEWESYADGPFLESVCNMGRWHRYPWCLDRFHHYGNHLLPSKENSFLEAGGYYGSSLILGQAIGRWGNFINQEAHGGPVSAERLPELYSVSPGFHQ